MRYERIDNRICKVDAFGNIGTVYSATTELNELIKTLNKQHDKICELEYKAILINKGKDPEFSTDYKDNTLIAKYLREKTVQEDLNAFKRVYEFLHEIQK